MKCAVFNCSNSHNTKDKKIGFFTFPKDEILQRKWVHFCRRDVNVKHARICSQHFLPEDLENYTKFEMGFAKYRELKPGAVPSVSVEGESSDVIARKNRVTLRTNKKLVEELLREVPENSDVADTNNVTCTEEKATSSGPTPRLADAPATTESNEFATVPSSEQVLVEKVRQLEAHIDTLRRENFCLREMQIKRDKEMSELQQRLQKAEFERNNIEEKLRTIFTAGQIRKLKIGLKRRNWSEEDISYSITLYSTSAKAVSGS